MLLGQTPSESGLEHSCGPAGSRETAAAGGRGVLEPPWRPRLSGTPPRRRSRSASVRSRTHRAASAGCRLCDRSRPGRCTARRRGSRTSPSRGRTRGAPSWSGCRGSAGRWPRRRSRGSAGPAPPASYPPGKTRRETGLDTRRETKGDEETAGQEDGGSDRG